MKTWLQQIGWQLMILHRNNLILISGVITLAYMGLFWGIGGKVTGYREQILTLLIFSDPAVIGLFFMGLGVIMERNQHLLQALFVSPLNMHLYLLSRILSLSLIGWISALAMGIAGLGLDFQVLHFSVGVWGTCVMFCLVGAFVVSYATDFLLFILKSIPLLLLFSLPLLNYYGLTNWDFLVLWPGWGGLSLIAIAYSGEASLISLFGAYLSVIVWTTMLYGLVYRIFVSRVKNH